MKMMLFIAPIMMAFSGCVSNETGRGGPSNNAPKVVTVSWENQAVGKGVLNVRVGVNGIDHFVARASTFDETSRADYARMGVPMKAALAGIFWAEGAHEEDAEGVYVVNEGSKFVVYTGYYSPGDTENVEWRPKLVIPF